MNHEEHLPGRGAAVFQEPTAEEKWRAKQPVFSTMIHDDYGLHGARQTSIAPGAVIEASDRTYDVGADGVLRRRSTEPRGLSKKVRRARRRANR